MLNIIEKQDNSVLTLSLVGRLDTLTAPQLEQEIKSMSPDVTALVLDLENLEYISSAGLRVLLTAHKKMESREGMLVEHVGEIVMEILQVTGFADILDIH